MNLMIKNKSVASIMVLILFFSSCSENSESYTVVKSDIVEAVYSSVTIEPKSLYIVNSSNSGYIDEINVQIGDEINFGDLIFSVRDVQSNNTASNAQLAYELAKNNYNGEVNLLEDLQLELDDAQSKRSSDSINFTRNQKLYEEGLITSIEYEQSELAFKTSKTRCQLINNKIIRSKSDLKTTLSQAKNNYNSSLSRSDDALVLSKIDGKIYDLLKESGEFVSMQEPVAMIGSKDSFIIKMRIDEVDITRVKLGQSIIVALEAYENQTFRAEITRISPKMDAQTQTFEIEGEFINSPESLFMGLTGEGNIVILEKEAAVVIPLEYLINGTSVRTSDGILNVEIGTRSLSHVEIISGLNEGDVVLKPE